VCGRHALTQDPGNADWYRRVISLDLEDFQPRYNIPPTARVQVVRDREGHRVRERMRWGLVPSWAKDPSIGSRMINARSETVAEKPSFRGAWRHRRRCLVLADGYYEWAKRPEGKVPHWFQLRGRPVFAFAGLWESWGRGEAELRSCTILTCAPNEGGLVASIHDRMPVILGTEDEWSAWTDPSVPSEELDGLLSSYPEEEIEAWPVSTYVNRVGNEGEECLKRLNLD